MLEWLFEIAYQLYLYFNHLNVFYEKNDFNLLVFLNNLVSQPTNPWWVRLGWYFHDSLKGESGWLDPFNSQPMVGQPMWTGLTHFDTLSFVSQVASAPKISKLERLFERILGQTTCKGLDNTRVSLNRLFEIIIKGV